VFAEPSASSQKILSTNPAARRVINAPRQEGVIAKEDEMLRLLLITLAVLASLTTVATPQAQAAAAEGRLVCLLPDPEDATRPDRIVVVTGFLWIDGVVVVTGFRWIDRLVAVTGFKPSATALPCWMESPATLLPPVKAPVICRPMAEGRWACSG